VIWKAPLATDNSPHKLTTSHRGKNSGEKFDEGTHTIIYIATDKSGNTAQCSFNVIVKGRYSR